MLAFSYQHANEDANEDANECADECASIAKCNIPMLVCAETLTLKRITWSVHMHGGTPPGGDMRHVLCVIVFYLMLYM